MSNKYVLDPSGKIIINGNLKDANEASEKILKNQNDFFQQRRQSTAGDTFNAARASLPAGLITAIDSERSDIDLTQFKTLLTSETPDFPNPRDDQEGHVIFPRKKNNQLLVNSSFGADSDTNINYYTPYNSVFSRDGSNRRIYAEELEMLTGLDLNSLGLSVNGIGSRDGFNSDFTQIVFIFDFLIESLAYIGTYWAINYINHKSTKKYYNDTPIQYYFSKIINIGNFVQTTDIFALFNYYVVGLDRFINTDPKSKSLRDFSNFDDPSRIKFFDIFRVAIRNLLSISKVGRNRMFLLIRKFQQESYWHTELLYKHKQNTSENGVDKFFIEFSNYYFKFIIERINIGYIVLNKNTITTNTSLNFLDLSNNQLTRNWGNLINDDTPLIFEENKWSYYRIKNNYSGEKSKTSISSLPQLFLTNSIANIGNENFALKENRQINESRRLPQALVKKVEEYLDNEYMPFYLHDLRTNEIVSMHAFLDSISDSFSPEYTSNSGYGRIDDVKHYVKTTRNINITFSLVSMQQEDHDLMWYQINKIVSMVYPQWSAGIPATTGKFKNINGFTYPFTQVPTASPLIRLRVGDVLKSNYTKKNIERLHFSKEPKIKYKEKYIKIDENFISLARIKLMKNELNKNDIQSIKSHMYTFDEPIENSQLGELKKQIRTSRKYNYLKPKIKGAKYVYNEKTGQSKLVLTELLKTLDLENRVRIKDPNQFELNALYEKLGNESIYVKDKERFKIFVIQTHSITITDKLKEGFENVYVRFMNYHYDYIAIDLNNFDEEKTYDYVEGITSKDDILNAESADNQINNPYTKAFETAGGKGLAGFITSLDVNYQDVTWETNNPGSNAPHSVKITMGFSPIHDIAPGLDHEGIMRAPIYNVGSLNNNLFGDVKFGDDK